MIAAALDRFGRIDILVNNAGRGMRYVSERFLTEPSRFWETSAEAGRLVIDTNVNGPFLMARAAVPHMLRAGWGRIIRISMNHETMWRAGFSPYGPSKAALESETIIWAQDLHGTGVTINALLPGGATDTGMIPHGFPEEARRKLIDPRIIVPPLLWLAAPAGAMSGHAGEPILMRLKLRRSPPMTPGGACRERSNAAGFLPADSETQNQSICCPVQERSPSSCVAILL